MKSNIFSRKNIYRSFFMLAGIFVFFACDASASTSLIVTGEGTSGQTTFVDESGNGHVINVRGDAQVFTGDIKFHAANRPPFNIKRTKCYNESIYRYSL